MTGADRRANAGAIGDHVPIVGPHHFERRQQRTEPAARCVQKRKHRRIIRNGAERGHGRARLWIELEHRAGDDAERALGPDKEMLQIIAGVVLDQLVEAGHDRAVGQYHFETEHEFARHAIADHAIAAGIGGEIAADRARSARTEIEREKHAAFVGRLLNGLERGSGAHRHGGACRIDRRRRVNPALALVDNGRAV